MLTTVSSSAPALKALGHRVDRLRARDPYFDALCESFEGLDVQIARHEKAAPGRASLLVERLKRQRQNFLDTIEFLLDDHAPAHRHAA